MIGETGKDTVFDGVIMIFIGIPVYLADQWRRTRRAAAGAAVPTTGDSAYSGDPGVGVCPRAARRPRPADECLSQERGKRRYSQAGTRRDAERSGCHLPSARPRTRRQALF